MDGRWFDDLARHLARRTSRRAVLKGAGGSLAAGVAAASVARDTDAFICRQAGVLCGKDAHCCSHQCDVGNTWRCIGCEEGLMECAGSCIDPTSDPDNCGGCAADDGEVCATTDGEVCRGGVCCTPCGPEECCGIEEYCVPNLERCLPVYYVS